MTEYARLPLPLPRESKASTQPQPPNALSVNPALLQQSKSVLRGSNSGLSIMYWWPNSTPLMEIRNKLRDAQLSAAA